ncbi:hypothetical protein VNO78_33504 [Psophocarpus tetragonolobus]|uniref:Uncharacterized protein n=1 Tax=Psophocarpus tetragonolobus TaxID=3891 RepID=A0AAN9P2B4_PSOTE
MNAWLPQASYPCDVPPQPNSPPDNAFRPDRPTKASLGSKKRGSAPLPIHGINDEAFGYLKRVIVTPAVYPRLVEFLHFDIQSTGQKSHCVNIRRDHRNALDPEVPVPNPSPDRHVTTRSHRGSRLSSPPTTDEFRTIGSL